MSNGASGLELLALERDNILLAQISALLHDAGKFCNRQYEVHSIESQSLVTKPQFEYKIVIDNTSSIISLHGAPRPHDDGIYNELTSLLKVVSDKAADYLEPAQKTALLNTQISFHGTTYSLAEIIILAQPKFARPSILKGYLGKDAWVIAALGACHREAHYDKQEPQDGHQSIQAVLASTCFGFENLRIEVSGQPGDLTSRLKNLPFNDFKNHKKFTTALEKELSLGLGDTRRPINEVDLWSWSSSVEALFKALAASSLLTSPLADLRQVSWRLLHIRLDGLSFLEQAPTISDLLGRQTALQVALDDVRQLLEITYPLGNEIYRDENGSAFVVPALTDDDDEGNRLRGLIESPILDTLRQSELGGELRPCIHITEPHKQAAVLHKSLAVLPPPVAPFQDSLKCWWQGEAEDVCTACGLRPQGWGAPNKNQKGKAQERNVCYVCLERRSRRAEIWARARHKSEDKRKPWERTIWLDEVADENGRLALVVGKFNLEHWLNGDMVQTLLVVCDPANSKPNQRYISKNPSFARLQRVWRTTQQFWRTVQDEDIPKVTGQNPQHRLDIAVTNKDELFNALGHYHACEAEINGCRFSVVWDSQDRRLLTASNLAALKTGIASRIAGASDESMTGLPDEIQLFEPGGYKQQRYEHPSARIDKQHSKVFPVPYTPSIALLTEPNAFMALVPATAALDAATSITERYEREMSKVRNRLPLSLGLVFFDHRQPLFSALDAGRRLLKHSFSSMECTVKNNQPRSGQDAPKHLQHAHFNQWQELTLNSAYGKTLLWRASTVMGDGSTDDNWYPYVSVIRGADGNPPARCKQFEYNDQHWIHVREVEPGDTICFTPSYFTWLFLDTSARRFEAGQKESVHYLEELARITGLWQKLKNSAAVNQLSENQLQAIVTLLATKGQDWLYSSPEYKQLAKAVLHKEGLHKAGLTEEDLISGRLQDTFELYHRLLKRRLNEEDA